MCADVVPARHVIDNVVRLRHLLGLGAFGGAYYAQPLSKENDVTALHADAASLTWPPHFVVKVMKRDEYNEHHVECIHREVQSLRLLKHPHVVQYIDAWVETGSCDYKGCYCLATNYCNGGDMRDCIRNLKMEQKYVSKEVMVQFMVQLFSALNYCHAHKIIHRDIKPANVFVQRDEAGSVEKVMVGDFGLSRPLENTIQLAKTRVGTPLYCSPEIVRGKSYGTKTDIFSAGALLYEFMTLEKAFAQPKRDDKLMCNAIVHQDPVPRLYELAQARYGVGLVCIVEACLSKAESHRPSACDVLTSFSCRIKRYVREANLAVYNEGRTSPVKTGKSPVVRRTPQPSPERHAAAVTVRATSMHRHIAAGKARSPCRTGADTATHMSNLSKWTNAVARVCACSVEDEMLRLLDGDVEVWLLLKVVATLRASGSVCERERVMSKLLDCLKPTAPIQTIVRIASGDTSAV